MIVRSISYNDDIANTNWTVLYIWSDIVRDNIIGIIPDNTITESPNTTFMIKEQLRGNYTFQVRTQIDDIHVAPNADFMIMLEFVKYKQRGKIL